MSSQTFHNFVKDLGRFMLPFAREALKKRGFFEYRLIQDWPQIVGSHLSRVSSPQKIAFEMNKKTDGVLHVEVLSASAPEFQHFQPMILERIATYFGYKAIGRIVIHQVSRLPTNIPDKQNVPVSAATGAKEKIKFDDIDACADPELKASLESLARALDKNNR